MQICKVDDAVQSCYDALTSIKEELEQWAENMPENLQDSERHDQVTDAASTLETLAEQIILDDLAETEILLPVFLQGSKPRRLARVAAILEQIATAMPESEARDALEEVAGEILNVEL